MATLLADKYEARKAEVNARFEQLRANEEELNRIFAKIYNMEGEVPIEVEDKYVSVARIFDTADEIPESYKGNKYVRIKRDEIKVVRRDKYAACGERLAVLHHAAERKVTNGKRSDIPPLQRVPFLVPCRKDLT